MKIVTEYITAKEKIIKFNGGYANCFLVTAVEEMENSYKLIFHFRFNVRPTKKQYRQFKKIARRLN